MKKMIVLFVAVVITAMSLNAQSVDSTRVNMINITNSSVVARVFFFGWSGGSGTMYVYENYGPGGVSNVNQFYTETYPVPYGTDSLDILLSGLSSSTNYFTDNYISYPFMMNATSPIVSFTTDACALSVSVTDSPAQTSWSALAVIVISFTSTTTADDVPVQELASPTTTV